MGVWTGEEFGYQKPALDTRAWDVLEADIIVNIV